MAKRAKNYGEVICETLEALGVAHVFGVPGSQNVALYEALRKSSLRTVLPTSELAGAFMANGYYRASGKIAALVTIPGPGFTYALTGLAEAYLDSAALLCLTGKPADSPGNRFNLQAIDQRAMATPVVKAYYSVDRPEQLQPTILKAFETAMAGEPGPVVLEIDQALYDMSCPTDEKLNERGVSTSPPNPQLVEQAARLLVEAKGVVLFVGQGGLDAHKEILALAETLNAPVLTTSSARGVLSEDHPLCFPFNFVKGGGETMNRMLAESDAILAIGCKFSHNGSGGFQYQIPPEKLIHVDASTQVLGANYPAKLAIASDACRFLSALLGCGLLQTSRPTWTDSELAHWRALAVSDASTGADIEPQIDVDGMSESERFFDLLRQMLPADACLVTDSGLHQFFVRRYFKVLTPRGLIIPSDFQSMGFGLSAAIGASLAAPGRQIVAVIGDGGFTMSGLELLTAVRERVPVKVILFNDGHLGLIRLQQIGRFGASHAVDLLGPDYAKLADALGFDHFRLHDKFDDVITDWLASPSPALLEVGLRDSLNIKKMRIKSKLRESVKPLFQT